ncbi:MAG: hypothetical protein AAGF97_00710 [Planctomycetota bacterium]
MKPDLLGYLLGALDGPEHEATTKQLERNSSLRADLHEVESRLAPLEAERWQFDPPAGLAARTCQLIAEIRDTPADAATEIRPRRRDGMSESREAPTSQHRWRMSDVIVTAGVLAASCMLFFPAVANSRYEARVASCQNNMRMFGVALPSWADRFSGKLPYIPTRGKTAVAGYYAPQLRETGYFSNSKQVICPSSALAQNYPNFTVPSTDEIESADGRTLEKLQRMMGGSYAYTLGHFKGGRHRATKHLGRAYFAVMSDQAQASGQQEPLVNAHGGRGIVVLFEDGHARMIFLTHSANATCEQEPIEAWNELFVNDAGMTAAGCDEDDVVLGASWCKPVVRVVEPQPCSAP